MGMRKAVYTLAALLVGLSFSLAVAYGVPGLSSIQHIEGIEYLAEELWDSDDEPTSYRWYPGKRKNLYKNLPPPSSFPYSIYQYRSNRVIQIRYCCFML
jgi:hypothetical protein